MKLVLTSLLALCFSKFSLAALVERDLSIPEDGLLTLDTQTGLEWLDFTATSGITVQDILNDAGSWLSNGFRYATQSEMVTLIENAGMIAEFASTGFEYRDEHFLPVLNLIGLLGWSSQSCADAKLPTADGLRVDVVNICEDPITDAGAAVIFESYWGLSETGAVYGNALVRQASAVPLPATAWLFISATVGLFAAKEKFS